MHWFLYDRGLRHKIVNSFHAYVSLSFLYFKQFVFIRINTVIFVRTLRRVSINLGNIYIQFHFAVSSFQYPYLQ